MIRGQFGQAAVFRAPASCSQFHANALFILVHQATDSLAAGTRQPLYWRSHCLRPLTRNLVAHRTL